MIAFHCFFVFPLLYYIYRCYCTKYERKEKILMNDNTLHDLAIAYAHAKLINHQCIHPEDNGYDSEIKLLVKAYYHACHQIPIEDDDLEKHF